MNREFLRQVGIFRPYPNEVPLRLLQGPAEQFEDVLAGLGAPARQTSQGPSRVQELKFLRVAKHPDVAPEDGIAAYVVRARNATEFALDYLYVDPPFRQRGLGRWLLGHAIGLSESKGARVICVPHAGDCEFLTRYGFARTDTEYRFTLTPE